MSGNESETSPRLVVIVPTWQECDNILPLIEALAEQFERLPCRARLLVVDDASPDGTGERVRDQMPRRPWLSLLTGKKEGLGAAYIRGMRHALDEMEAEIVVEMDADFSHRPADLPRLVGALGEGADFVIGSRYVPGGTLPDAWGLRRRLLSRGGNRVARLLVPGCREVHDCTAGFRAIRASLLRAVPLERMGMRGYIFQVALLHEALRAGAHVREIPVAFEDRLRGNSKLGVSDIMEFAAWCLSVRFGGGGRRSE